MFPMFFRYILAVICIPRSNTVLYCFHQCEANDKMFVRIWTNKCVIQQAIRVSSGCIRYSELQNIARVGIFSCWFCFAFLVAEDKCSTLWQGNIHKWCFCRCWEILWCDMTLFYYQRMRHAARDASGLTCVTRTSCIDMEYNKIRISLCHYFI